MSDEGELQAIAAGDSEAFGRWVSRAESRLRLSVRSFARVVDVEVVLQETLLRAWQVAPRVQDDGRPEPLLRLAIRIARNLAIDEARRSRRVPVATDVIDALREDTAAVHDPDPGLRDAIAACRDRLPRQPKAALSARLDAAGGRDDRSLAESLGMRLNTFLQNFGRARKLLLECLRSRGIDPDLELS